MGSSNMARSLLTCMKQVTSVHKTFTLKALLPRRNTSTVSGSMDLSGMFPPIATPFKANDPDTIDYDKLRHNLDKLGQIPLRGYVVQGSNGEYAYLSNEERVELIGKVRSMIPKDKLILAGSGCESTRETIKMTQKMAEAGADAALVVTPFYYKSRMTDDAMKKHFSEVANQSPIPIILYSVPANTGLDLSPAVIAELSKHPNVVGLKDSGGDITKIGQVIFATEKEDFQVLAGSASFLYTALNLGAVGGVCALANILGNECCELMDLVKEGNHKEAKCLQQKLIAPNNGVTKVFGVAGLKIAMEWFEYYGGPVRSPLQPLTPEETSTLRRMFVANGFLNDRA